MTASGDTSIPIKNAVRKRESPLTPLGGRMKAAPRAGKNFLRSCFWPGNGLFSNKKGEGKIGDLKNKGSTREKALR
jgi:hypothetical protein